MDFAIKNITRDWTTLLFSDEKRFSLDRPDGNIYQWVKGTKTDQIIHPTKRQNGGQ